MHISGQGLHAARESVGKPADCPGIRQPHRDRIDAHDSQLGLDAARSSATLTWTLPLRRGRDSGVASGRSLRTIQPPTATRGVGPTPASRSVRDVPCGCPARVTAPIAPSDADQDRDESLDTLGGATARICGIPAQPSSWRYGAEQPNTHDHRRVMGGTMSTTCSTTCAAPWCRFSSARNATASLDRSGRSGGTGRTRHRRRRRTPLA